MGTGTGWQATAALVDQVRRALYEHVRGARAPVSRDEAAQAVGVSRNLAAFHLDKLVEVGLLTARYANPPDRPRGPGRVPKVYEPSDVQVSVTIPQRRYELIGDILVDAVAHPGRDVRSTALRVAAERGREVGLAAGPGQPLDDVLDGLGFEPECHGGTTRLRNCPFHPLAAREPDLVCGINQAFVRGLLEGLGERGERAVLAPRPGACCVEVTP